MTIREIYEIIKKAVKSDDTLIFNGALVSDTAVTDLLQNCFYATKGDVIFSNVKVTESSNLKEALVDGIVKYPIAEGSNPYNCVTNISITVDNNGKVLILLKITLPEKWTFSNLFPGLKEMPFNNLELSGAFIIVSSASYYDSTYDLNLDPGMSLAGLQQLQKDYLFLVELINLQQLVLYGQVSNASKNLMSLKTKSVNGKLLDTPLKDASLSIISKEFPEKNKITPVIIESFFKGSMPIGSNIGETGDFSIEFIPEASLITVQVSFNNTPLSDFALLIPFIGNDDPLSVLPDPIENAVKTVGKLFLLKELKLQFDYQKKSFVNASATIGLNLGDPGLELFPPIPAIVLKEMDFTVTYNGTDFSYSTTAYIKISTYELQITLQTEPNNGYTLYIKQSDATPLHLKEIINTLLPSLEGFPELEVTTLEITISPPQKQYILAVTIKDQWKVPGTSGIMLDEVSINGLYNGNFEPKFTGQVLGTFSLITDVNNPENDVKLFLLAKKDTNWLFSGYTGKDQEIPIGKFIKSLVDKFQSDAELPAMLTDMTLENISMSFDTGLDEYKFGCELKFPISKDVKVDMILSVDVIPGKKKIFGGVIYINEFQFSIEFAKDTTSNIFIATYASQPGNPLSIHLRDLVRAVSPSLADAIPDIIVQLEDVKFVYYKESGKSQFAFGVDIDVAIDLSKLPVIGKKLPKGFKLDIKNLSILYASETFTNAQSTAINALLPTNVVAFPADGVSKGTAISGVLDVAGYKLPINTGKKPSPTSNQSISFTGMAEEVPETASNGASPSSVTWFNINKQIGPLKFDRIGVEYANNVLSFAMDATLELGPATLTMMGLSFGSQLTKFVPEFGLDGFAFSINTPSLDVEGAFLKAKSPDGATAYYGELIAKFGTISIKVLGGDTPAHTVPNPSDPTNDIHIPDSFFIYASINAPIGGPPYLYLNGFAGGFGINDLLKLPTLENLPGYILLPASAPKEAGSAVDTISKVLPQLQMYFIATPGEYWVAAGVAFSSFEMINAFALLTVSFGVDFQIAVLGTCSMSFPTAATNPIAYVEIDILASYSTSTGLLEVEGILSPASYIIGSFCQITGGFAFYIWIDPPMLSDPKAPKKGDFVVTLGGYHPAFIPPPFYPKVPRLGINFNLGPFHVIGGSYFALTPGMFMAGTNWNATFDISIVKVWFKIGADFLIAWAPFHYLADVYVSLGCDINLGLFTIHISIGADLLLWGPPFGGRADIDLDIVAFTISFGAEQQPPEAIGWKEFKSKFLPGNTQEEKSDNNVLLLTDTNIEASGTTNILKSTISHGLMNSDLDGLDWILDPNHFNILIASTIPVSEIKLALDNNASNDKDISHNPKDYNLKPPTTPIDWPYLVFTDSTNQMDNDSIWNLDVNIKPMSLNKVNSIMKVSLLKADNDGVYNSYINAFTLNPTVIDSPAALWGEHKEGEKLAVNSDSFLKSCLTGFNITPLPRVPNVVNGVLLITLLYQQGNNYYFNYQIAKVNKDYEVKIMNTAPDKLDIIISGSHSAKLNNEGYILSSLEDDWVSQQRSAILDNLNLIGFSTYKEVTLSTFANETILTDWPEVMLLGDELPV